MCRLVEKLACWLTDDNILGSNWDSELRITTVVILGYLSRYINTYPQWPKCSFFIIRRTRWWQTRCGDIHRVCLSPKARATWSIATIDWGCGCKHCAVLRVLKDRWNVTWKEHLEFSQFSAESYNLVPIPFSSSRSRSLSVCEVYHQDEMNLKGAQSALRPRHPGH